MIINCIKCNKKFEIDSHLIPENGRLLQCGSCNHQWHFIPNIVKLEEKEEKLKSDKKNDFLTVNEDFTIAKKEKKFKEIKSKNKIFKKNRTNFLNILIVFLISFIALILILDTFQPLISIYIPNIDIVLENFYETLKDINLFIKDLIKN